MLITQGVTPLGISMEDTIRTIIADIETDGLNATKIWCICWKDVETGEVGEEIYPEVTGRCFDGVDCVVGHNFICFDMPILRRLISVPVNPDTVLDTLVLSRLLNYSRPGGHSLEQYGKEFKIEKTGLDLKWDVFDPGMVARCHSDVAITEALYLSQKKYIEAPRWQEAIRTEHFIANLCNTLESNGLAFDITKAKVLYSEINTKLEAIDSILDTAFPPKLVPREPFIPRITKSGKMHKVDERSILEAHISEKKGEWYILYDEVPFNPKSAKDRIERLNEAGWRPANRTKGHIEFLRSLGRGKRAKTPEQIEKKGYYETYGWKTDEENLATLPDTAPVGAQRLKERLLLQGKATRLEEWFNAYNPVSERIHGTFTSIGSWPHRLSHSGPNMANVPKFISEDKTPYSDKMRGLWVAPRGKVLVGVDAEGIQLRIFAHLINDPELIASLEKGKKEDGTDPHSLNKGIIGRICQSRDAAKRFIYALFFDMGDGKAAEVLDCSREEAKDARNRLVNHYPGYKRLKEGQIPECAARGYFEGLDGRLVFIAGETQEQKEHYCLSGMLQNGEKIITARAAEIWVPRLEECKVQYKLVNYVHDEFVTECLPEDAAMIRNIQCEAIHQVGLDLKMNCRLSGEGKIGKNWMEVH